jgi:membrane fusion protein (multidrug efflux system)
MPLSLPSGARRCTVAAAALSLALTLAGCDRSAAQAAKSPASPAAAAVVAVGVQTLQSGRVSLSTELSGRVSAPVVAEVRPQVRGLVRAVKFTEGAAVQAGQVLYEIDPDAYRIALAGTQAAEAKAQATLDAARLTAQRRADLFKIEGVSQQDLQDAQTAVKQAEADLASARTGREAAQLNLQRTRVTAPIAGRADVSTVTTGALVTADQTAALTTVRQLDPIQVDVGQSSAELLRLRRDFAEGRLQRVGAGEAQIQLLLEDGSRYPAPGRLRFTGFAVGTTTGTVTLRATFPNPDGLLMPGQYVRAVLETGTVEHALVVPQQALQRDTRGGASVLVVDGEGKVQRRPVSVSRAFGNGWLVSDGVQPGERVVVEGLQKVKPGDKVQVHEVDPAAPVAVAAAPAASR